MVTMPRSNANDDLVVAIKMEQETTLPQENGKGEKKQKQQRHQQDSSSTAAVNFSTKFSPNCPVVYYNESTSLVAMGTVVSFDNHADRYTINALNQELTEVLPTQLSFAPRCPVWVLPWKRASKWKRAKILGCYQKDSESFYSVEEVSNNKTLIHHGIPLDRIRYDNGNDDVIVENEASTEEPRTDAMEGSMEIEASIMEPTAKEATYRNGSSLTQTEETVGVPSHPENRLQGIRCVSIQAPEKEEESLQTITGGVENDPTEASTEGSHTGDSTEIEASMGEPTPNEVTNRVGASLVLQTKETSNTVSVPSQSKNRLQGVRCASIQAPEESLLTLAAGVENASEEEAPIPRTKLRSEESMEVYVAATKLLKALPSRSSNSAKPIGTEKDPNHGAVSVASTTTTRRVSMDTTAVSTTAKNVQSAHPENGVHPARAPAADAATRRVSMEQDGCETEEYTKTMRLPQVPKVLPSTSCAEDDALAKSSVAVARRPSVPVERSSPSGCTIQQGRLISPFARDKSSEGTILSPVSSKILRKGASPKGATVSSSPSRSVRTTSSIVRLLQKAQGRSFPPPPPLVGNDDTDDCNRGSSQNDSTTAELSPTNSKIPRKLASPTTASSTTATLLSPLDGKVPRKGVSPKGASNRVTFSPSAESPTTTLSILNSLRQPNDGSFPPPPPLVGADESKGDPEETTSPENTKEHFSEQPMANSCSPDRFMQAACEVSSEIATQTNHAAAPAGFVTPDKEQDFQDGINDHSSVSFNKRPYSNDVNEGVAAYEHFTSPPPKRYRTDPYVPPQQSNCSRMSHGGMFRYMLLPSWLDQSLLGERIIGIGGKTHKELQKRFNCGIGLQTSKIPWRIKVKFDSESGEQHMRAVLFELENIVLTVVPKTELPLLLYEMAHMNGYGERFGNMVRQRAPWNPNSTTCEAWMCRVPFPPHFRKQLSGIFIGKKGVGLSRIYKETGCNISLPTTGEPCCIVAGVDPQLVQKTVGMVQDQLRWAERVYEEIRQKHALLAHAE